MNKLLFILLLFFPFNISGDYPLKNGKPTSKGIEQYIEEMSDSIVVEYQNFVGDTLYDIWIYAEDLTSYAVLDSMELGWYYPDEIYITTAEMFLAYELADLPRIERALIEESNTVNFSLAAMISSGASESGPKTAGMSVGTRRPATRFASVTVRGPPRP